MNDFDCNLQFWFRFRLQFVSSLRDAAGQLTALLPHSAAPHCGRIWRGEWLYLCPARTLSPSGFSLSLPLFDSVCLARTCPWAPHTEFWQKTKHTHTHEGPNRVEYMTKSDFKCTMSAVTPRPQRLLLLHYAPGWLRQALSAFWNAIMKWKVKQRRASDCAAAAAAYSTN